MGRTQRPWIDVPCEEIPSQRSARQFVAISASGHFWMKSGRADYLVAYAVPRS
jgi:glucose dehydrogenase